MELPLLTVNWTQGRVLSDGTFTSKPDMRMDVVAKQSVHSLQEGKKELLLCAFKCVVMCTCTHLTLQLETTKKQTCGVKK